MGGGGLLAQKYQPKYLREDDQNLKNLTVRTDNDGWIEFKKDAKLNPNNFFKDYAPIVCASLHLHLLTLSNFQHHEQS